jgi:integrase
MSNGGKEMTDYHVFRKQRATNHGKITHKWYYYFVVNGKQVQKVCKGCKTKNEAIAFVGKLPARSGENAVLIKTIAETMYLPGSEHMKRRIQLGRPLDDHTMLEARFKINIIIEKWGERTLESLTVEEVTKYLFSRERSGSWKQSFLIYLREIYHEGPWYGCKVTVPVFPKFAKHSRKSNIFMTEELNKLLVPENFPSDELYLFFLCCLSGGLRLGEAAGIRVKQIFFESRALIIDGFLKDTGVRTVYNKKGSEEHPKIRIVPLPAITIERLKNHIARHNYQDDDFIFRAYKDPGKTIGFWYIHDVLARAIKKAEINTDGRKLGVHSFRYTYVTRMRRELPADIVMKLAGHTTVGMTELYNQKVLDATLKTLIGADTAVANLFV